jgi:hypothetical protein
MMHGLTLPEQSGHSRRVVNNRKCSNDQEKCRIFTEEQKAEAVRIVECSDKPIHQVAEEMGLSASALSIDLPIPSNGSLIVLSR